MLVSQIKVVDADSHITEPPDLWTTRVGRELLELAPRTVSDEKRGFDRWWVGSKRLGGVGASAAAGWPEPFPSYPPTLEQAHPASWNPSERLKILDEYGLWAQVLYPNLLGFSLYAFLDLPEPLRTECVKAYNDFLVDFASEDPARFIPITVVPFWDIESAVTELRRCAAKGHRGALFPSRFERVSLPRFVDTYWDRFYATAQDLDMSINFHTGFQSLLTEGEHKSGLGRSVQEEKETEFFEGSVNMQFDPMRTLQELLTSGLCDRFPTLKFVAVESGVGWLPHCLETLDWNWAATGRSARFPQRSMPSEYFYNQVYATFSYEKASLLGSIEGLQDNVMFSTDFPHPASLAPGPCCPTAESPIEIVERLATVPHAVADKVLRSNAARVYNIAT
ncbi:amidohydrolase family protein [Streptomyces sp. NPDC002758]